MPDVAPTTPTAAPVVPSKAAPAAAAPTKTETPKVEVVKLDKPKAEAPPAEKPPEPKEKAPPAEEPVDEYEIDGKVQRLTKTQARTLIQKAAAADKRLQEATEKGKKIDELLKLVEEDPEAFLAKTGKDPQKMIEQLLAKRAKLELLTPEQRKVAELEAERDKLKADRAKAEEERTTAAQRELDQRNQEALEEQLIGAAEKYQLDKNPDVLEGLADVALELLELGVVPTVDQVAQEYMRRETEHIERRDRKVMSKLKGDKLLRYLGDAVLKEIDAAREAARQASLERIPAPQLKPKTEKLPPRDTTTGKFVSEVEFDKKFLGRR